MANPNRPPITYADSRDDLPKSDFAARLAELRIARTFAEQSAAKEQDNAPNRDPDPHRDSDRSMVGQDRPFPAPRPSLPFAADVDAASFDARWEAERRRASQTQPTKGNKAMSDQFQTEAQSQPRRPEETLREGSLKAAIWRNEGKKGAYHQVTLARTYKDRDGQFQDTSSFRSQDMLGLAELARRTHHEVQELDRAAFKEQRRSQAAPDHEKSQAQAQVQSQSR
ncbi:MAG: hypothetical protein AAF511_09520 [Pseudomonadota bacterium]